jgi:hypothetical protein
MHKIHRTAVYAIRTYGGVGGGSCKASSYPDRTGLIQPILDTLTAVLRERVPPPDQSPGGGG